MVIRLTCFTIKLFCDLIPPQLDVELIKWLVLPPFKTSTLSPACFPPPPLVPIPVVSSSCCYYDSSLFYVSYSHTFCNVFLSDLNCFFRFHLYAMPRHTYSRPFPPLQPPTFSPPLLFYRLSSSIFYVIKPRNKIKAKGTKLKKTKLLFNTQLHRVRWHGWQRMQNPPPKSRLQDIPGEPLLR
jgi:hypothetical protein